MESSIYSAEGAERPTSVDKGNAGEAVASQVRESAEVHGATSLSNDVVAAVVGLAVREVKGVHGLLPFGTGEALVSMAKSISGDDKRDLGVHVEKGELECAIDLRLEVEYGASIPEVSRTVRIVVARRVKEMCGLAVREVNIDVAGLHFDSSTPAPVERRLR